MTNAARLSLRDISKFVGSVTSINRDADFATEAQKDECKAAIEALYTFGSHTLEEGMVWNWGMNNPAIDELIQQTLPLYRRFGTDGFSEQLYFYTLQAIGLSDLKGKKVVDVGCGFGEGLNFLCRSRQIGEAIGVDLCGHAIDRATARLARPGLRFVRGDAEQLPFGDEEVDVLINVESSHNYPDLARFVAEVQRVLKPGGYFSHVDVFSDARYASHTALKAKFNKLHWMEETDITKFVKDSITARMLPGSFLRSILRKKHAGKPIACVISEGLELANYGADFVDYRYTKWQRAVRALFWFMLSRAGNQGPQLKFTRYVHTVAQKR